MPREVTRGCAGAPRVCGDDPPNLHHYLQETTVLPAYAGMIPNHDLADAYAKRCSPRMRG